MQTDIASVARNPSGLAVLEGGTVALREGMYS
jgi:hypothetical protein